MRFVQRQMTDKRWFRSAIASSLLIGIALCAYLAARQGIGAWYFRQKSPQAIQAAIGWDPGNPEYFDALGTLTRLYSDSANPWRIIELYKTAVRLSPENAQYWADLGSAYEGAGRTGEALGAFERAAQLFPRSPDINWKLANFYIRAGRVPEGLRTLQKVLLGDAGASPQVFALATSATRDSEAVLNNLLPPRPGVFFDYIDFQDRAGRIKGAQQTWTRLLQLNLAFDLRRALPYLDSLIQQRETAALAQAWSALAARFPDRIHPSELAGDRITNGSFEFEILNGGLDWRVAPVEGVIVSVDSLNRFDGVRSLRIEFDGSRNIVYGETLQYALVEPDSRYELSAHMRVEGITTDSGPRMEVFDPYDTNKLYLYTSGLVGDSEWSLQRIDFKTGPDTRLIVVRVARPASKKLDNRIKGEIWLDQVSLVRH